VTDDPLLTARGVYRYRPLVRVVFDRRLRTPPAARLLSTADAGPVIIVSTPAAISRDPARAEALSASGAQLVAIAADESSDAFIVAALARLTELDCTSLVVEGGPTLHAAFWRAGVVDRIQCFLTPHMVGPSGVPSASFPIGTVAGLADGSVQVLGDDILIEGYVHRAD
jgi:diaminohydroxyphosphoribosylaminopyrimidine deaminase/5-amino-6-(5-phosphoribosylamino)uracil reductase